MSYPPAASMAQRVQGIAYVTNHYDCIDLEMRCQPRDDLDRLEDLAAPRS